MRFINYRIKLYYQIDKLQSKNWKKHYFGFYGNEIPNLLTEKDNPATMKLYEGDIVIYDPPSKPNHPNRGLKAVITKIHKPLKKNKRQDAFERGLRLKEDPNKVKSYDLKFQLDPVEKEERRINLAEGNKSGQVKDEKTFVTREKIKGIPHKKLMVSIDRKEFKDKSESEKKEIIKKKINQLLNGILKASSEFKPKYVDKTGKNYETWEQRQQAESLLPYEVKEKTTQIGDVITTGTSKELGKEKKYERPTKKYTIQSYTIKEYRWPSKLETKEKFKSEDLDTMLMNKSDIFLSSIGEFLAGVQRGTKTRVKFEDQFKFPKFGSIRSKNGKREKEWKKFLIDFMYNKIYKRGAQIIDDDQIKEIKKKTEKELSFLNDDGNDFIERPIIEQMFIIRKIIGREGDHKNMFYEFINNYETKKKDSSNVKEFKEKLESLSKIDFSSGSQQRIGVEIIIFLNEGGGLAGAFGFESKCNQVFYELGDAVETIINKITTKKKKGGTRRKKKRKGKETRGRKEKTKKGTRRRKINNKTRRRKKIIGGGGPLEETEHDKLIEKNFPDFFF